jgi:hypothetical protein
MDVIAPPEAAPLRIFSDLEKPILDLITLPDNQLLGSSPKVLLLRSGYEQCLAGQASLQA